MVKNLIEATMKRSALIVTSLVIIMVWGGISAARMQRDYMPPITNPTLMVSVHAHDFQADQLKASVAEPVKQSVRNVNGLEMLETSSFDGGLLASLSFPLNYDMDRAQRDVSFALEHAALPAGADKPTVTRVSTSSFPIMRLTLTSPSGKVDENTLRTTVQSEITKQLSDLPGVGEIRVTGGAKNGYMLSVRMADLAKAGLTLDHVKQSLAAAQSTGLQGTVVSSQLSIPIQAAGQYQNEQDFKQLPIRGADGHAVPLSAVADVSKSIVDLQTISRTDGRASVVFDVLKTPSANITDVSEKVRSRIAELPGIQPGDVKLAVLSDQGEQVNTALYGLLKEGLLGCLLSMVSVFLFFRNMRSTLLIALSLPICFLATTGLLNTMGISLNILTVSGLVVAMGRVIDDTIVILDNMYRKAHESRKKIDSTLLAEAVREMLPAIIASTATTVAVFIPIALVGGMIGAAFSGFAWSVTIALLSSFLVAVLVVPALYYAWNRGRVNNSAFSVEPAALRVLSWGFQRKGRIAAVFGLLVLGAGAGAFALPVNFLPANHSGQINVQLEFPARTAMPQVDATVKRMEQALQSDANVANFSSALGSSFTPQFDDVFDAGGGWIQGDNIANIVVSAKNGADIAALTAQLQKQLAALSGSAICTVSGQNISGDDSQLKIDLSGADSATLDKTAQLIRSKLQTVSDLSVVGAADANEARPGYQVVLNRETLERTGVRPEEVYRRIRDFLSQGTRIDVQTGAGQNVAFSIRTDLLDAAMNDPEAEILSLMGTQTIKDKNGSDVHMEELAALSRNSGPSVIREREGTPFAQVTANITSRHVERVSGQVKELLQHLVLPPGVQYSINGISAQVDQMIVEMAIALSVSVVCVMLILSLVFRGWRAPLSVLVCMPPAFIGSILGLVVCGGEWNLATLVGLLMLSGIVATNGIVLVDKIERNLATGMNPQQAILLGTASRVRPVIMTALTTILTLLPLCMSGSGDTVVSQSLGIVVVCGMISSTAISLLLIPILYAWMHRRGAERLTSKTHASPDLEWPA